MAKSTCNPNREAPKGMLKFQVIRSNIKDSVGQYCVPGDMAILTKKMAEGYLAKNFIKVALPDFDEEPETNVEPDASKPDDEKEVKPDPSDEEGAGASDGGKDEDNPSPRPRKRRTRSTADSA